MEQFVLEESVQTLKELLPLGGEVTPQQSAQVYLASLHLLCEIKKDQVLLEGIRESAREDDCDHVLFPDVDAIPAIRAVVYDTALFRVLILCLSSVNTKITDSSATTDSSSHVTLGRKRSMSLSAEPKGGKIGSSPVPMMRAGNDTATTQMRPKGMPYFHVQTWAGTVLSAAWEYFDHWPAPMLQVYADDCFGPRFWVDNEHCQLFTANLALAHKNLDDVEVNELCRDQAAAVADTFRTFSIATEDDLAVSEDMSSANRKSSLFTHRFSMSSLEPRKRARREVVVLVVPEEGVNTNNLPRLPPSSSLMNMVDPFQYPLHQKVLRSKRIRQRFVYSNLFAAHETIFASLSHRLDVKSKQNLNLLQCLPTFICIPGVRTLVALNLEKWLQSPALAASARSLLSITVAHLQVVDPPLPEDLKVVECVIGMKLKANQINTHIDNVKAIAKRLPFPSVILQMYSTFLNDVISLGISPANSDQLRMIGFIHPVIQPIISYEAIAAAMLMLLLNSGTPSTATMRYPHRNHLVRKLRNCIRDFASLLGKSFDGLMLVNALLSFQVSSESWSYADEEDKARLMFQCVTLTMAPFVNVATLSENDILSVKSTLRALRKQLLTWCCTEYGPYFRSSTAVKRPDYFRTFVAFWGEGRQGKPLPHWLEVMRCVLFLEASDSPHFKSFFLPGEDLNEELADWEQELARVRFCNLYGGDVHNDMIWIVLKSSSISDNIDAEMAIYILEHLVENCGLLRYASFNVNDPNIVWDLYNLVLYTPDPRLWNLDSSDGTGNNVVHEDHPRLAYPGLWWRVTMIALVICANSPSRVGAVVWQDHPTLRALMKMVTTNRFRFPPIDCDELQRNEMKRLDYAARDEEQRIAELLFLPRKQNPLISEQKGARMSRRLQKQQEIKEAARELAETKRRRALLRDAQKSIMLWDPDGPARKPPPEAVEMLYAANYLFKLSDIFQRCIVPDFILLSIGQTNRHAIERAYDWLIPIISSIPNTIARLPSSASCFLLLRAYSTETEEQTQLKELSAPLLRHVQDSLRGNFGEQDAVKAFDLLLTDVASRMQNQRRCARKVLQDSLLPSVQMQSDNPHSWMLAVLDLDCAKSLVGSAIHHMSAAIGLERGGVLKALLMALRQHIAFATRHRISIHQRFPDLLCLLLSSRPIVCSDAFDSFPDLLVLATEILHSEFFAYAKEKDLTVNLDLGATVALSIYKSLHCDGNIQLPLSLLQAVCVILGVYRGQSSSDDEQQCAPLVADLSDSLLHADLSDSLLHEEEANAEEKKGLADAFFVESGIRAISVEWWIILVKSRSHALARRAALSAPTIFLSRLLLCSALSCSSLFSMVDRLGSLGNASFNKDELYGRILTPSAFSEWDVGRLGSKVDVARQLLGRVSAYMRLYQMALSTIKRSDKSLTFVLWLVEECKSAMIETPSKSKSKKQKFTTTTCLASFDSARSVLSSIRDDDTILSIEKEKLAPLKQVASTFQSYEVSSPRIAFPNLICGDVHSFMEMCVTKHEMMALQWFLEGFYSELLQCRSATQSSFESQALDLAVDLWHVFHSPIGFSRDTIVLHTWLPRLTHNVGNPKLWGLLFQVSSQASDFPGEGASLLWKCIVHWTDSHIERCQEWIIYQAFTGKSGSSYDFEKFAMFLSVTSGEYNKIEPIASAEVNRLSNWAGTEEFVTAVTPIAINSLIGNFSTASSLKSVRRPHVPASGLTLLIQLSEFGKKSFRIVCGVVLSDLSDETKSKSHPTLQVLLLRLYLLFPHWMDVGAAVSRQALVQAAHENLDVWNSWPCHWDDRIDCWIDSLAQHGDVGCSKALIELSRKQPLLILRKLPKISIMLSVDASPGDSRKRIEAPPPQLKLYACTTKDRAIEVSVRKWGDSFEVPLWILFLDVVQAMPSDVLHTSLSHLNVFLLLYLELLLSSSSIMTGRLKTRFSSLCAAFRLHNPEQWKAFMVQRKERDDIRGLLESFE